MTELRLSGVGGQCPLNQSSKMVFHYYYVVWPPANNKQTNSEFSILRSISQYKRSGITNMQICLEANHILYVLLETSNLLRAYITIERLISYHFRREQRQNLAYLKTI